MVTFISIVTAKIFRNTDNTSSSRRNFPFAGVFGNIAPGNPPVIMPLTDISLRIGQKNYFCGQMDKAYKKLYLIVSNESRIFAGRYAELALKLRNVEMSK
jgi:hypothetical protein